MGLSLSSVANDYEFENNLISENQKNALELIFKTSDENDFTRKNVLECLETHLKDKVSDFSSAFLKVLTDFCDKLSQEKKNQIRYKSCMVEVISKLISLSSTNYDYLGSFIFEVLLYLNSAPNIDSLSLFLSSLLQIFKAHPSYTLIKMELDCLNNTLVSWFINDCPKGLIEQEYIYRQICNNSVFQQFILVAFRSIFLSKDPASMKDELPIIDLNTTSKSSRSFTPIISFTDMIFLNYNLIEEYRHEWRLLYSSSFQGESFSKFSSQIINQGPIVVVIRDDKGHVFGGFMSENVQFSSQFQGNESSFVFSLQPKIQIYNTTGYNRHFCYLNTNQETLPNGFGMGGQHFYFGIWISSNFGFGHCKAKPKNTTFGCPMLSAVDEFKFDQLEVWGVGKPPKKLDEEEEDQAASILDKDAESAAMLEIIGKQRVSEGFREDPTSL